MTGPLFIEFVGLPGSGKSTIATALLNALQDDGHAATSRTLLLADKQVFWRRQLTRSAYVLAALLRHPLLFGRVCMMVLKSGQEKSRDCPKVLWNFWTVTGLLARLRRTGNKYIMVDQGLFQAIWSIDMGARSRIGSDRWVPILSALGISDVVLVVIDTPQELARKRIEQRGDRYSRMSSRDKLHSRRAWDRAESSLADVLEISSRMPSLRMVRVVNGESANIERLTDAITTAICTGGQ